MTKKSLLITLALVFGLQILYSQELAKVREDGGEFGYVTENAEFVIKPTFRKVNDFADGYSTRFRRRKRDIDTNCKVVVLYTYNVAKKGFVNRFDRVKYEKKRLSKVRGKVKLLANKWYENAELFVKSN